MCLSSHTQILCQWDKRKHPVHVKMNVNWRYQSEMLCSLSSKASFVFFVSVCVCACMWVRMSDCMLGLSVHAARPHSLWSAGVTVILFSLFAVFRNKLALPHISFTLIYLVIIHIFGILPFRNSDCFPLGMFLPVSRVWIFSMGGCSRAPHPAMCPDCWVIQDGGWRSQQE